MIALDRISIELTNQCSKACWFCYNASAPDRATRWQPIEVIRLVRDCAGHGIKAVAFGGGEPLEYAGLWEVLTATRGRLFRSLTTNGLALDRELSGLVACAPDKVHVSIHFPGRRAEVTRAIRQVHELARAGIASGVNLVVRASQIEDAVGCGEALRASGIANERITYLPMRGGDTPTPAQLGRVAGGRAFQSMSCLTACRNSPRFAAISWDRYVAWCSYTRSRHPLERYDFAALQAALVGLGLVHCDTPRVTRSLPMV